ncbi:MULTISPECIES: nucleotide exchange factor GrpE [unclassified Roseitalea]|uniref:nucleotide exchange factor GrpE n=1 Tax=unclassified Roseitalea TaxID=2639107 RepID=UPI002740169B|nr:MULTISPECIES: nucleotide exchange factor GrpE [unclassified Roseitalea]
MADNDHKPEGESANIDPNDRDKLRKAADELLKADRAARKRAAAEDADAYAEFEASGEHFDYEDADSGEAGETISEEIAAIQAENADMKDRLLRLAADMENLRRRTQREVADAKAFSIANFARDMLGVSDNLRRAIEAVTDEQREGADETLKQLLEGVELTEKSMLATMQRHGVKQLEPEGEKFDPNFHQAMFEVPNPDVPSGTVVQVVQAGYSIGDRVLRPAMVGIAKGGPKEPRPAENDSVWKAEPGPPNEQAERDA